MRPPEWRETCDDRARDRHDFSRRDLLKGGGALIVGFSLAGVPLAASAARGDVAGPPDPNAIDSWIAIHADNTATVYFGKCELGQGNTTGMLQIAAEELDLAMGQISAARLDTNVTPNQGATSSSSSIERGGPQLRAAAAEARRALLLLASRRLGVQINSLVVNDGVVSVDGEGAFRAVKYGELLGDKPFNVKSTGTAPQKPPHRYKLVGTRVPRVDLPDKMSGRYELVHHLRVPGMLHGRVVLPRGQRAFGAGAKPLSIDESSIKHIPTARVVRKGDFVGVVAENEWDAVKAAAALKVTWQDGPALPGNADLFTQMRAQKTTDTVIANRGDVAKGFAGAAHVRSSAYFCPYQGHLPFGPNCALADVRPDGALVQSSTQDVYNARAHAGARARHAAREGAGAVLRRLRHLRAKLLRGRRAGRRDHVAGGRPAGARAVHALGRARLGQLRPGASRRGARRRRRRGQARRLRVPRLAARLDRDVDHPGHRACRSPASSGPRARPRSRSTR